jgi:hypothetical protein
MKCFPVEKGEKKEEMNKKKNDKGAENYHPLFESLVINSNK